VETGALFKPVAHERIAIGFENDWELQHGMWHAPGARQQVHRIITGATLYAEGEALGIAGNMGHRLAARHTLMKMVRNRYIRNRYIRNRYIRNQYIGSRNPHRFRSAIPLYPTLSCEQLRGALHHIKSNAAHNSTLTWTSANRNACSPMSSARRMGTACENRIA